MCAWCGKILKLPETIFGINFCSEFCLDSWTLGGDIMDPATYEEEIK